MCGRGRGRGRGERREIGSAFAKEMEKKEEAPEKLEQKTGGQDVKVKKIGNGPSSSSSTGSCEEAGNYLPRESFVRRAMPEDDEKDDPIKKKMDELIKKWEEKEKQRVRRIVEKVEPKVISWRLRCERELTGQVKLCRWKETMAIKEQDDILRQDLAKTRGKRDFR